MFVRIEPICLGSGFTSSVVVKDPGPERRIINEQYSKNRIVNMPGTIIICGSMIALALEQRGVVFKFATFSAFRNSAFNFGKFGPL